MARYPVEIYATEYFDGAAFTAKGVTYVQQPNQDRYAVKDDMAIVLDGLGGPPAGDIAAEIVLHLFETRCDRTTDFIEFLEMAQHILEDIQGFSSIEEYERYCIVCGLTFHSELDARIRRHLEMDSRPFFHYREGRPYAMGTVALLVRVARAGIHMVWIGDCKGLLLEDGELYSDTDDANDRRAKGARQACNGNDKALCHQKNRERRKLHRYVVDDYVGRRGGNVEETWYINDELEQNSEYTLVAYTDGISDNLIEEYVADLVADKEPSAACLEVLELLDKMLAARIIEVLMSYSKSREDYPQLVEFIDTQSRLREWKESFLEFIESHDRRVSEDLFEAFPDLVTKLDWNAAFNLIRKARELNCLSYFSSTVKWHKAALWSHIKADDRAIMVLKLRLNGQNGTA